MRTETWIWFSWLLYGQESRPCLNFFNLTFAQDFLWFSSRNPFSSILVPFPIPQGPGSTPPPHPPRSPATSLPSTEGLLGHWLNSRVKPRSHCLERREERGPEAPTPAMLSPTRLEAAGASCSLGSGTTQGGCKFAAAWIFNLNCLPGRLHGTEPASTPAILWSQLSHFRPCLSGCLLRKWREASQAPRIPELGCPGMASASTALRMNGLLPPSRTISGPGVWRHNGSHTRVMIINRECSGCLMSTKVKNICHTLSFVLFSN